MRNSRPGGKSSTVSEYPEAIDRLTETLNGLPGIGKRNAERLAMALFGWNQDRLADFAEQAASLHERVFTCEACGHLADGERCRYCLDPTRDPAVIAVVEDAKQVIAIEKSHMFRGLYHVLGGKFSPLDGVEIEDLNVESLYERLDQGKVREVILATSPRCGRRGDSLVPGEPAGRTISPALAFTDRHRPASRLRSVVCGLRHHGLGAVLAPHIRDLSPTI